MKAKAPALEWEFELSAFKEGKIVCGTDEAGRGPLAGRVYAAAVVLPAELENSELALMLNDSKKLSEKKRFELAPEIKKAALSSCVAYSTVEEIESTDILSASQHAMRRAVEGLSLDRENADEQTLEKMNICFIGGKKITPDLALVDGNIARDFKIPTKTIVGGDGISPSIAAASVLAKTERDLYCMTVLDALYPEYGFAAHKGYGTRAHYAAVEKYGLCPEHRKSFFKKYFAKKENAENE